jgi:lipopolysaccharide/colanic/teichoic acid biosynthesis glycosyltransferase
MPENTIGSRLRAILKRSLDMVLAGSALVLLLPLLILIALAVCVDSPGNPIYKGRRVGRFGTPFKLVKFRTMVANADRLGPLVTAGGDPRITRLGRILRRTKLDELPSLWNVVAGDMSLVGPRPENERSAALYSAEQRKVLTLRPGLTSLATLKYRHEEALLASAPDMDREYFRIMQDKLNLELQYLRQQTLSLDFKILFKTVYALFK